MEPTEWIMKNTPKKIRRGKQAQHRIQLNSQFAKDNKKAAERRQLTAEKMLM